METRNYYNFSFVKRNPYEWDISTDGGRIFAIRGEYGNFSLFDYRNHPSTQSIGFKTLDSIVSYCMAELMFEN